MAKTPQQIPPSTPIKAAPLTYTVGIGNSDDKLSQEGWSDYIDGLGVVLAELGQEIEGGVDIQFFGYTAPQGRWQSCSAVFNAPATKAVNDLIRAKLALLAGRFGQDSIALTVGPTTFVKAV